MAWACSASSVRRDPRRDRAPARSLRDRPALSTRPRRRPPARACAAGRQAALLDAWRGATGRPPLVRDPTDRLAAISARGTARAKAIFVGLLATGFAARGRRSGLPVNDTFAGFSDFRASSSYAEELSAALREPGRRHLVMCHPAIPTPSSPARSRRRAAAHGVRRADAGREPALADLAAVAQGRRARARLAAAAG